MDNPSIQQIDGEKRVIKCDLNDYAPVQEHFLKEVLEGLKKPQKELPSKYFYDEAGSKLFAQICTLDEYYIPSTEAGIMQDNIEELTTLIGKRAILVEYGCGDCSKVRRILSHLNDLVAFIPIDISKEQLLQAANELALDYPTLDVLPVCADYTSDFEIPKTKEMYSRIVIYFPGSTISNFDPIPAKNFLRHIAKVCGPGGALLIGVDLKKDPEVLHRAYNDSRGVTAAFNTNILKRINREIGADFQLDGYKHYAFYNSREGRIEMHLVSLKDQQVHLDGATIYFAKGESIWTESSYKYNIDEFAQIAEEVGFRVAKVWTDKLKWFSVQYLVAVEA